MRQLSNLMKSLAIVVMCVLVVLLTTEYLLFLVLHPSPRLLEALFPICHYGIIGALFAGLVLAVVHYAALVRERYRLP